MKSLSLILVVLSLLIAPAVRPALAEEGWEPLGPPGGEISQLVVHPRNPQILWASTFFYGLYKSVDGGASWRRLEGLPAPVIRSVAVAPGNPDVLYAVAGGDAIRVYRSSDGGETWRVVLPCGDQPPPCCGCIPIALAGELVVHPRNPQTVFALSRRGLFKSIDGGARWRSVGRDLGFTSTLVFDPRNADVLYAGTIQGLFKSTNGGESWRRWGDAAGETFGVLVIDPRDSRRMWALGSQGVYRSTDGGAHWKVSRSGISAQAALTALALSPGAGTGRPTVWAGTTLGVYRSLDGGLTWAPKLLNRSVSTLATHPSRPETVWAGTRNNFRRFPPGIYKSVNRGAAWSFSSRGILHLPASSVAFDPATPGVLWAAANSVFRSADGGATWVDRSGNLPILETFFVRDVAVDPRDSQTVWAGTTRGVFVTEDGGATWEPRREGLTGGAGAFPGVRFLRFAPSNPAIVYAATFSQLFRTVDAGVHWTLIPSPPPDPATFQVEDLLVDPRDPDVVFATQGNLWRSGDGGNTWTSVLAGSGDEAVRKVAADPRDPDLLYAAGEQGVFRSADGGQSWQRVLELRITSSGDVAVGPAGEVWAGGRDIGVYFSPDGISGWTVLPGLDPFTLSQLEADPHHPSTVIAVTTNFASGVTTDGLFRHVGE